jgi:hypothetical protein
LPLSRLIILQQALLYKTHTDDHRRQRASPRYDTAFEDQEYVDLACITDRCRPISMDPNSYDAANQLVAVHVSSYQLTTKVVLESLVKNLRARRGLAREVHRVWVDVKWLQQSCRPDVTNLLDTVLFGEVDSVMRVAGVNTGTTDGLALSCTGKAESVDGFLSLPQGHNHVNIIGDALQKAEFKPKPKKRKIEPIWYDKQHQVTPRMAKLQRDLHEACGLPYAPPPPTDRTQIVKLKWLKSKTTNKCTEDGIWHGLFAIDMGVSASKMKLQECSLMSDWVESAFTGAFRRACKDIATTGASVRNKKKFLYIPAGDSRNAEDDPPPMDELLQEVTVEYQQGELDSCLRHSLSSALHSMGFVNEAKELALEDSISGSTVGLVAHAVQFVNKLFRKSHLVLKKMYNTRCSVGEVALADSSWPMLLLLQTSDGIYGSHAVTAWNGMIFDSTCTNALRWSQRSLDWCTGLDSTCIGFSKVYRLCPMDMGRMLPDCGIQVGFQLTINTKLGWVKSLPKKGRKGYIIRYVDGVMEEMSYLDVLKYVDLFKYM